ncbi:MAG: ABC transporter ATP-binding protein [Salinarimonadaceae bacterium]|nr:MAG: ABC transporter ATP-binding protein [Salinarimonadaceae bacterium]
MDVAVSGLVRRFGEFVAVNQVSFQIPSGRCLALLGPSGCGKTTTLNIVAGFLHPDEGDVHVNKRSVLGIAPHKRNTGIVFQNYALFPHMTVFDNVAYGLRQRKTPNDVIAKEVPRALELVQLENLGHRFPRELSGGQQQRVALARAVVFKPDILLLDEPLSNLDAKLRETMRLELKSIQRTTGVTTIFVTHDQAEAMVLADEIAVMNAGVVEQIAEPEIIYNRPATRFVADFVGSANFLRGEIVERETGYAQIKLDFADQTVRAASPEIGAPTGRCEFMIRPERINLSLAPTDAENELEATITNLAFTGSLVDCYCAVGDQSLHVQVISSRHALSTGQKIWISWDAREAFVLRDAP